MELIIPSSAKFYHFQRASHSAQNYLQQPGRSKHHNVGLCSITEERQLKLELDENIFVKPSPSKLAWKLSSNSLIQQLTMFYFGHVYELISKLLGLGTLFLLVMLLLQTICRILSLY
ncbi:hypothetical protein GmHk_05G013167 [Glycine max]|nr:hypothetical protein GmHk_05G013167 [Glycine max]